MVRLLIATIVFAVMFAVAFVPVAYGAIQVDTGSPLGTAIFTIIAAIAQLERSLIVERVRVGLRRARAEGKRLGRPRLRVDHRRLESVAARKLPVRLAARELGVSPSSYLRLVRAQVASSSEPRSASCV